MVQRPRESLQQPLTPEQLQHICERAFGSLTGIAVIDELTGGTINTTYRISFDAHSPVILRVAPSDIHPHLFCHEHRLLRREYGIQPFLAPLAQWLPALIAVDFIHQLILYDYLIQSDIPGTLWRDVHTSLTPGAQHELWRQLGAITRQLHQVEHTTFGTPDPVPSYDRWSDALLADLDNLIHDMETWHIPAQHLHSVMHYLSRHCTLFDSGQQVYLLHGDLWLNNVLIQRLGAQVRIVGVLDAGFAQWGDPDADWTMMRLRIAPPEGSAAFWEAYGATDQRPNRSVRSAVYHARSIGWSLLELQRRQHTETAWLWSKLAEVVAVLSAAS